MIENQTHVSSKIFVTPLDVCDRTNLMLLREKKNQQHLNFIIQLTWTGWWCHIMLEDTISLLEDRIRKIGMTGTGDGLNPFTSPIK